MPGEVRLEPIVALTDAPTADENHAISSGLARFNEQQSGLRGGRPLAVIVRDPETRQPVGGLTGRTSLGVLFIDRFFLPDALRGHGLGSRLLQLAEKRLGSAAASAPYSIRSIFRRRTSTSATATRSSASFHACRRGPAASS